MPSRTHRKSLGFAALACALALSSAGCQKRTVQAAPPVVIAPAPVDTPPASQPERETKPGPVPEIPPSTNPAPSPTPPPKPAPRKPAPPPKETPEPEPAPPKPAAPQMSVQLSPEELAKYQRSTNEDIATAEKNLQQAYGRDLNAAQHDLVEKIRSFLGQAREGIRESDWVRARNLAQKARVLSVDLVNSL